MLKPGFFQMLESMTDEYIKEQGTVTCEFSTDKEDLEEKQSALDSFNQKLEELKAKWVMFPCDTSAGHDVNKPVHLMIDSEIDQAQLNN